MSYIIYGTDGIVVGGHKGTKILNGIYMIEDDYIVNRKAWENDSRNYNLKALIGYGCDNVEYMANVRIDYIITKGNNDDEVQQLINDNELTIMQCYAPKNGKNQMSIMM
jgi:hypothetical protein